MTDTPDINNAGVPDLSEMIEKLKNNPEIVTAVASAFGISAPTAPSDQSSPSQASPTQLPEILSAVAPLIKLNEGSSSGHSHDHRTALLCALRPYLSPERQEIIDYIMKFSKIGELLGKLK